LCGIGDVDSTLGTVGVWLRNEEAKPTKGVVYYLREEKVRGHEGVEEEGGGEEERRSNGSCGGALCVCVCACVCVDAAAPRSAAGGRRAAVERA